MIYSFCQSLVNGMVIVALHKNTNWNLKHKTKKYNIRMHFAVRQTINILFSFNIFHDIIDKEMQKTNKKKHWNIDLDLRNQSQMTDSLSLGQIKTC